MFSVLVTTESRHCEEEFMSAEISTTAEAPQTQHLNKQRWKEIGCWSGRGVWLSAGVADVQQMQCHHGQQSDRRLQSSFRGELQGFNSAAGFQDLMIFFNGPAC